jgi:hypothetical protein
MKMREDGRKSDAGMMTGEGRKIVARKKRGGARRS